MSGTTQSTRVRTDNKKLTLSNLEEGKSEKGVERMPSVELSPDKLPKGVKCLAIAKGTDRTAVALDIVEKLVAGYLGKCPKMIITGEGSISWKKVSPPERKKLSKEVRTCLGIYYGEISQHHTPIDIGENGRFDYFDILARLIYGNDENDWYSQSSEIVDGYINIMIDSVHSSINSKVVSFSPSNMGGTVEVEEAKEGKEVK